MHNRSIGPLSTQEVKEDFICELLQKQASGLVSSSCEFNHHIHTPFKQCREILLKIDHFNIKSYLVMFNMEFIHTLSTETAFYDKDVTFFTTDTNKAMVIKCLYPQVNIILSLEENMKKFDVVVGNPPYDGEKALHQQFFVKGFSLLNPEGHLLFIQPATMYFNKKDNRRKKPEGEMLSIVKEHAKEIIIKNEKVFGDAAVATKLAITVVSKEKTNGFTIEYENGFIEDCTRNGIEGINQLQIPSDVFLSMKRKVETLCKEYGTFEEVTNTHSPNKAFIPKIRGHVGGMADFYTLIPKKESRPKEKYNCGNNDFGIPLNNPDDLGNFYSYCELFFTRFCLSILKFNINQHRGELANIPLIDFSTRISDTEMFQLVKFTKEEIEWVYKVIKPYY